MSAPSRSRTGHGPPVVGSAYWLDPPDTPEVDEPYCRHGTLGAWLAPSLDHGGSPLGTGYNGRRTPEPQVPGRRHGAARLPCTTPGSITSVRPYSGSGGETR